MACVVGDPIAHSLSPAIHNAAFGALGLDWIYTAFPTTDGAGAVDAMRVLHISGMSVTMPCKEAAAAACDELSPTAAALGSANALVLRDDGSVFGESTDGPGLLAALVDESVDVAGRAILVLGAGGAARAATHALTDAGGRVRVAARRSDAAERAVRGRGATVAWSDVEPAVAACDVVVNATPIGMGGEPPPFRAEALHADQVVVDLVYDPPHTPMMAAAAKAGARTVNGLGMLVHQAAIAFELWTGVAAPVRAMQAAVGTKG